MKNSAIVIAALACALAAWALWSQQQGHKELTELRRVVASVAERPPLEAPSAPSSGVLREDREREDTIAALNARISELENVASGQADVLESVLNKLDSREKAMVREAMRAWGPEQATGEPDTPVAGDYRTAWASAQADGGIEWLQVGFDTEVEIARVRVRETYNPGALIKIAAMLANGAERTVWQGEMSPVPGPIDREIPLPAGVVAKSVKIYLDTRKVAGWNEIDAVQIIGRDGSQQWATSAEASSTYATGRSVANQVFSGFLQADESSIEFFAPPR